MTRPYFYPRSPCGERPRDCPASSPRRYFYPRSPCGERPNETITIITGTHISIHALLAESDWAPRWTECRHPPFLSTLSLRRATRAVQSGNKVNHNFYPRSPCGERLPTGGQTFEINLFLSTLSLRRATGPRSRKSPWAGDFYPRSPCGERPSILHKILADWDFYPRSPCGERPSTLRASQSYSLISIHALLAESDWAH